MKYIIIFFIAIFLLTSFGERNDSINLEIIVYKKTKPVYYYFKEWKGIIPRIGEVINPMGEDDGYEVTMINWSLEERKVIVEAKNAE